MSLEPGPGSPPPLDAAHAARRILEAEASGEGVVSLLILEGPLDGFRRLVPEHAPPEGALGTRELEDALDALARRVLTGDVEAGRKGREAGVHRVAIALPGESEPRELEVYLELFRPPSPLIIVGAGHLSLPLTRLGALLGYRVTVLDDRPEFARAERFPEADRVLRVDFQDPFAELEPGPHAHVILVTRGHKYDYECLRRLLRMPEPPCYVGMIGSRRRVRATFHQLAEDGVPPEVMERIRSPVGLDLGGETPAEIAVEVAAELVMLRRGGSGRPLVEVEGVARRFFGTADADPSADESVPRRR